MNYPKKTANEIKAVALRYSRRKSEDDRYSLLKPDVLYAVHERQKVICQFLEEAGKVDMIWRRLSCLSLVEVGCGAGGNLMELLRMGFAPENLVGLELLKERFEAARRILPSGVNILQGDACEATIRDGSQDIILASTVFSSILDDAFQVRLAETMWRWLRPGGAVLWYDFTWNNPANMDVRGIPLRRIKQLWPKATYKTRRVTLAPPLARLLVSVHPSLLLPARALPFLRTHLCCWIRKP